MATIPATYRSSPSFTSLPGAHQPSPANDTAALSRDVIRKFLKAVDYTPGSPLEDSNTAYQSMLTEFSMYNVEEKHFKLICNASAALAEHGYPLATSYERLLIARSMWYMLYIDDLGHRFPEYLEEFQRVPSLDRSYNPDMAVVNSFRAHLQDYDGLWDPIAANGIKISAMEFINGCMIEQVLTQSSVRLSKDAVSFPYFLRMKTGCSLAFAYMIFPKSLGVCVADYIQAIEDICCYVNLVNDLFSYYKEHLEGDTNNYIHCRARITGFPLETVMMQVYDEAVIVQERVSKILYSTPAFIPWKRYMNGFISFHMNCNRYRLGDLGL